MEVGYFVETYFSSLNENVLLNENFVCVVTVIIFWHGCDFRSLLHELF